MRAIIPYLHLIRLHKPVGIILLMLPCWWGILAHRATLSTSEIFPMFGWFALGAIVMRSAGCIINDAADRRMDAQVARTASRPLATGIIRLSSALTLACALVVGGACIAYHLGMDVFYLSCAFLPLVILYPFMKRFTYWPQAFLGITFGSGALFGTMASVHHITPIAWWLYAGSIFWVIGYDTIYACQDRMDDARIGIKSTALRFGSHLRLGVALCYLLAILCWMMAQPSLIGFTVAVALLIYQIVLLRDTDHTPYHLLFRMNMWVGAAMCVAYF